MIEIVGAGMAGLLAANMMRHRDPVVLEAQPALPHNHSAVLRFRSPAVGDLLGIQFKKVTMIKSVLTLGNPVADALAYSAKNLGVYKSDRSVISGTVVAERYIAPPDLIERMAERVEVRFGSKFAFHPNHSKVISTIPMPYLMSALKYPVQPSLNFGYVTGVNLKAKVDRCDAYVSLIVPDPAIAFSRVSLTGNELIIELPNRYSDDVDRKETIADAVMLLGISPHEVYDVEVHEQHYAKIAPIDEEQRRSFIFWASTIKQRAFSLGRFATWRPGLLLDDLINDVRVIERLMDSKSPEYDAEKLERDRR